MISTVFEWQLCDENLMENNLKHYQYSMNLKKINVNHFLNSREADMDLL